MSAKLIWQLVQLQFHPPENKTHTVSHSQLACLALYYEILFIISLQTKVNENAKHVETELHKYTTNKAFRAKKTNLPDSRPFVFFFSH